MIQLDIKRHLDEAAIAGCSPARRDEIRDLLMQSCRDDSLKAATGTLFVQTVNNHPELLPMLFPAFAVLCGERETITQKVNNNINWGLTERPLAA